MTTSWRIATHAEEPLDPSAVLALFAAEGWWPERTPSTVQDVLDRGPAVAARVGRRVVGFARAVSDGAFRAYVEDVVVDREFRGRGLARELLEALLEQLPDGATTTLFCDPELVELYRGAGFSDTRQVVLHRRPRVEFVLTPPAEADDVLTAYYEDIVTRWYGRPATPAEVSRAMAEGPSHDLTGPTGALFVVRDGPRELGCGGLRHVDADVTELTRVWIAPAARGRGLGSRLVRRLEGFAAENGRTRIRLDTRDDLVEARAMYARLGYADVEPFNDDPYAHHWLGRDLP
ncbi:GNAT family N-acetyltransferase [Kineococcus sp. NBC_00420]|uniref:GNAT family N-acetyltransferase n=1 Tax=Kineococcus sp. NBC_00420 TaxID=2903564 RepID=UPI002E238D5B